MKKLSAWVIAWRRWRVESQVVKIDREIDGIRVTRLSEELRERELDQMRQLQVRRLRSIAQEEIDLRSRDNVRAIAQVDRRAH